MMRAATAASLRANLQGEWPMRQTLLRVAAGIICSATPAVCQVITGNIVGQITDASGAVVPQAEILIGIRALASQ